MPTLRPDTFEIVARALFARHFNSAMNFKPTRRITTRSESQPGRVHETLLSLSLETKEPPNKSSAVLSCMDMVVEFVARGRCRGIAIAIGLVSTTYFSMGLLFISKIKKWRPVASSVMIAPLVRKY